MSDDKAEMNEELISVEAGNENNIRSISKELFTDKNIPSKTDLSAKQINGIARTRFALRWLGRVKNPVTKKEYTIDENFEELVKDIEVLSASKGRQSRKEFVETMQIQNAQASKESFWGKMGLSK